MQDGSSAVSPPSITEEERVFLWLVDGYQDLTRHFPAIKYGSHLNRRLLFEVVLRYFRDLERIMKYHPLVTRCSWERRLGYAAYWITKIRPVQLAETADAREELVRANAYFAFWVTVPPLCLPLAWSFETANWCKELIYTLHCRPVSGDQLMLTYEAICKTPARFEISPGWPPLDCVSSACHVRPSAQEIDTAKCGLSVS